MRRSTKIITSIIVIVIVILVGYFMFKPQPSAIKHQVKQSVKKPTVTKQVPVTNKWENKAPQAIKGLWINDKYECVFTDQQANNKFMKPNTAWSGSSWKPEYKYNGNGIYQVRSGYMKGQGYLMNYMIRKTHDEVAILSHYGKMHRIIKRNN